MHKRSKETGFTIVELLIVVAVIAILAAISVVAYTNIQNRANASAVKADLAQATKKLMVYRVDNGRFPQSLAELTSAGISTSKSAYDLSGNNFYYCLNRADGQFAIGARTAGNAAFFYTTSSRTVYQTTNHLGFDSVRQEIGLTNGNDPNAWASSGYAFSSGSGTWAQWTH